MTNQKPATPDDDGVSPYLQQPLRSFEQVRQDRKRLQTVYAEANASRQTDIPLRLSMRFKT